MQCTQCQGYELEPQELEPGLIVAQCSRCEGALLSLLNYRFWAKNHGDQQQTLPSDIETVDDQSTAKQCAKCARLMVKYRLSHAVDNRLDFCVACDEVWLDKGEWQLFKQLQLPVQLPQVLTDSWQRHIRDEQRAASLKKTYVDLLGAEDYQKLASFKRWLDAHDSKTEMKHFLTINESL